jgi:hypothetical protein
MLEIVSGKEEVRAKAGVVIGIRLRKSRLPDRRAPASSIGLPEEPDSGRDR